MTHHPIKSLHSSQYSPNETEAVNTLSPDSLSAIGGSCEIGSAEVGGMGTTSGLLY